MQQLFYGLKWYNTLEFPELDVSPGKKEVKQGKLVKFISPAKSQNINPISPNPKFILGILQIKSAIFQWLV